MARQFAVLIATRSAPASSIMRFCNLRLNAPPMSKTLILPFHRVSALLIPPEASRSNLNGLPSRVMEACVRIRCCAPVPSSVRSAVSITAAPPDTERLLPFMSAWSGRFISGEPLSVKSRERMFAALPICRPRAVPERLVSNVLMPSDGSPERWPCMFNKPSSPKPKRDKSGAVILRLRRSPFLPKLPSVLMMFCPRRKSIRARGRWRDS